MKIDYTLILSAGFGTRMKSIGQVIPKPLWPIFEKSILELEIDYARKLGAKKVYINVHHQSQQITSYFKDKKEYKDVHFLYEKEILDIGGAIHNLASQEDIQYRGKLMILNGDQFLFFDTKKIEEAFNHLKKFKVVMMAVKVDPVWGHAQTILDENNFLKKIIPNKEIPTKEMIYTYSGMAIIDLEKLDKIGGKTSLYESVAKYKDEDVKMVKVDKYEYWDFGTIERYWNSLFDILDKTKNNEKSEFIIFMNKTGAFNSKKYNYSENSYNSVDNSINLSSQAYKLAKGQIVLPSPIKSNREQKGHGIICGDLFEKIDINR